MNVSLEKLSENTAKITVKVDEVDYADKMTKELKKIGATHSLPGFRKGHVPMGQLQRMFGRQVKSDILNHEVFNAVINYINENKLEVLGEPLPVEKKEINLDDKDYTFEYELGLAPDYDVVVDKSVKLPYYAIKVSEEMEKEQDTQLRNRFGSQGPSEEYGPRALVKGVMMELDENGAIKETEDAIQVTAAIVAPFLFKSKEEADKFEGTKVGDKVVFNPWNSCEGNPAEMASMLNIERDKAVDVKSDFQIAISEIIVNRPAELGQEFYDEVFGKDKVTTEEDYFKNVRAMIAAQLAPNSENLFRITTEKALVDKFATATLPEEFLKRWLVARNDGVTAENVDAEYVKMEPQVKWELVKERIAKQADIKVEEDDVLNMAKSYAAQRMAEYGMFNLDDATITDQAKRLLADNKSRSYFNRMVGDNKLFNAIKAMADVETKEVTLDEFTTVAEEASK